jgi:hypothetical protein
MPGSDGGTRTNLLFTMSYRTGSRLNACCKAFFSLNDLRSSQPQTPNGGAGRDRTDDILLAKQALSQLSYGPNLVWHQAPAMIYIVSSIRCRAVNKNGGPG